VSEDRNAARRARIDELRAAEKTRAGRRRAAVIGAAVLVAALVAGGVALATSGSGTSTAFCGNTASGSPDGKQWSSAPAMSIDVSAAYSATLKTSCGDIGIKLDARNAPHTVNSFVFLAQQDYFDHTPCHRLTTSGIYVLQCGDPTGTGSGGPGYSFKDENLKAFGTGSEVTYPAGTVAMANSGPNTNGSQFFLVYKDSPLPPSYTPFGTITGGLDVINQIAAVGSDNSNGSGDGHPKESVIMQSVTATKE
jgi:peptidyl-prolyl cis-trans isomerase B (cyclophilin B)